MRRRFRFVPSLNNIMVSLPCHIMCSWLTAWFGSPLPFQLLKVLAHLEEQPSFSSSDTVWVWVCKPVLYSMYFTPACKNISCVCGMHPQCIATSLRDRRLLLPVISSEHSFFKMTHTVCCINAHIMYTYSFVLNNNKNGLLASLRKWADRRFVAIKFHSHPHELLSHLQQGMYLPRSTDKCCFCWKALLRKPQQTNGRYRDLLITDTLTFKAVSLSVERNESYTTSCQPHMQKTTLVISRAWNVGFVNAHNLLF